MHKCLLYLIATEYVKDIYACCKVHSLGVLLCLLCSMFVPKHVYVNDCMCKSYTPFSIKYSSPFTHNTHRHTDTHTHTK
jgi:hypothetical protein